MDTFASLMGGGGGGGTPVSSGANSGIVFGNPTSSTPMNTATIGIIAGAAVAVVLLVVLLLRK